MFQRRQSERSGRTILAASSLPGFTDRTQAGSSSWLPGKHRAPAIAAGQGNAPEENQAEPAEPRLGPLEDTRGQKNLLRSQETRYGLIKQVGCFSCWRRKTLSAMTTTGTRAEGPLWQLLPSPTALPGRCWQSHGADPSAEGWKREDH